MFKLRGQSNFVLQRGYPKTRGSTAPRKLSLTNTNEQRSGPRQGLRWLVSDQPFLATQRFYESSTGPSLAVILEKKPADNVLLAGIIVAGIGVRLGLRWTHVFNFRMRARLPSNAAFPFPPGAGTRIIGG